MNVYVVFKSGQTDFEIFSDLDVAKRVFINHLLTEWQARYFKEGLSEQEILSRMKINYQKIVSKLENFKTKESYFFNANNTYSPAFFWTLTKCKVRTQDAI